MTQVAAKYALALTALLATGGIAYSQHPSQYDMPRRVADTAPTEADVIKTYKPLGPLPVLCRHVMQTYPSGHFLLLTSDNPLVRIHCGSDMDKTPVYVIFAHYSDLQWYVQNEGHREIIEGDDG
jgi:hypothetical protein